MELRFKFGKNWAGYLKRADLPLAAESSRSDLCSFLGLTSLEGLSFIDFGCGSGLHSLAALELGAEKVISVDLDPEAIACTEALKEKSSFKEKWEIKQGSLLDKAFIQSLGQADVVYCWGVAHHTGQMWTGLEHLALLTQGGGSLWVAIYNKVEGRLGSLYWQKVKRFYNSHSVVVKKIMEGGYLSYHFFHLLIHGRNPWSVWRNYYFKRGMSWRTDLIDWLGGYPYEYASVAEIFHFFHAKKWELVNIKTTNYLGCNQFLFRKEKLPDYA